MKKAKANMENVPTHIAIIMDGNRRWARERFLPELAGHTHVAENILETLIEHGAKRGVKYMTFWAWSTENWGRKEEEVSGVMEIFRHVIKKKWQRLHEKGVRIKIIGDTSKFPSDIQKALSDVVEQTKDNTTITTIFALNYGGRDEIMRSMNHMMKKVLENAKEQKMIQQYNNVTIEQFTNSLDTASIPDPDLIVRTGGEQRLSGFLLWQSEYSELMFPSWYMPEFTPSKLDEIIEEFGSRARRFGK